MTGTDGLDGPPPVEDVFAGDTVEQRIYGTILHTREPTAASAIADAADCDLKAAREWLSWFAELRIVTRHDGRPVTYKRNDAYFEWRRVNELATTHSGEELRDRMEELTARIAAYEQRYDATSPGAVDADAVAEASDERTIDEVYIDLGAWATAREQRDRCERAQQYRAGGYKRESPF